MKVKPTGLKGGDKIQRIQNLMDKLSPLNESVTNSSLEHVKYGPDGITYAIVRENHTYFIKTSEKRTSKLVSEDFEYVGGLQNKMNESYRSYEEALKHLNMKFRDLNESYGIRENIDLFRSDLLLEEKKKKSIKNEAEGDTTYKLKVDAPDAGTVDMGTTDMTTTDVTTTDMGGDVPTDDMATDVEDTDVETTDVPDEDTEGDEETGDLEKDIQRLTGKIGQKFRELDEPDLELEKYVINSILSAIDVDSMEDEFKEELISKIEGESTEEDGTEEEPTEEEPVEEPTEEEPVEEPTEEVETETKTEGRVYSKKTILENLKSKKLLKNKLKKSINESYDFEDDFDGGDIEIEKFSGRGFGRSKYRPLRNPNLPDNEDFLEEELTQMYKATKAEDITAAKSGTQMVFQPDPNKPGKTIRVEDETIYEIELDEDSMEEGNAFTKMLSKTKKGGTFKIGDREYKDTSSYDSRKSKRKYMDEDDDLDVDDLFDYEDPYYRNPEEEDDDQEVVITDPDKDSPYITPDDDEPYNPFKPKIKPQIQPKGRGYDKDFYV